MTTVKGLMGKLEISGDGGNTWTEILSNPMLQAAALSSVPHLVEPQLFRDAAAYEELNLKRRMALGGVISMPRAITPLSVADESPESPEEPIVRLEERRYSFPELTIEMDWSPEAQERIKEILAEAFEQQSISLIGQAYGVGMVEGIKSGLRSLPPSFNRFWADDWSNWSPAPSKRRAKRRALKHRIDKRVKAKRRG